MKQRNSADRVTGHGLADGSLSYMPLWTSIQEFSQAFVSSIGDWSPSETLRVGQDPGGSRVLEALVNAAAASKAKKKLLRKLKGMWAILAVEPGGNHVVESCFIWGVRLCFSLAC